MGIRVCVAGATGWTGSAGSGAEPYVSGTLLAARKVLEVNGLVRGLDRLLFPA